jgi:hypothetical protein
MSRHARAALAAAVVVAAFTLQPAAAGERATLKVTARVVDRCTVEVPFQVPPGLWRDRRHQPWRLVRHECRGGPPFRIDARSVLLSHLRARLADHLRPNAHDDGGHVQEVRHPTRDDVVLITITY